MILVYRPELESPPMDKECTLGFSFITGTGLSEYIQITSGVNRDFPEAVWDIINGYDAVKNLLNLGALRVVTEEAVTVPAPEATGSIDSISDFALNQALSLVEDSFDVDQLNRWLAKEGRIRVRNTINKRLTALAEGKG